jgi:hypothetical protein
MRLASASCSMIPCTLLGTRSILIAAALGLAADGRF